MLTLIAVVVFTQANFFGGKHGEKYRAAFRWGIPVVTSKYERLRPRVYGLIDVFFRWMDEVVAAWAWKDPNHIQYALQHTMPTTDCIAPN